MILHLLTVLLWFGPQALAIPKPNHARGFPLCSKTLLKSFLREQTLSDLKKQSFDLQEQSRREEIESNPSHMGPKAPQESIVRRVIDALLKTKKTEIEREYGEDIAQSVYTDLQKELDHFFYFCKETPGESTHSCFFSKATPKPRVLALPDLVFHFKGVKGPKAPFRSLVFSGDQSTLLATDKRSRVHLFSTESEQPLFTLNLPKTWVLQALLASDQSSILTVTSDKFIRIWDGQSGALMHELNHHSDVVRDAVLATSRKEFVTISHDGSVQIGDTLSGKILEKLPLHSKGTHLALSPNEQILVSGDESSHLTFWDFDERALLHLMKSGSKGVKHLTFSPNSHMLASISGDGTMHIWNAYTGRLLFSLISPLRSHRSSLFSPNNQYLASLSDENYIELWSMEDGRLIKALRGHTDGVETIAFTEDSKHLITGSKDNTIRLWELPSGRLLHTLRQHKGAINDLAVFQKDEAHFLSASDDGQLLLWKLGYEDFSDESTVSSKP